MPVYNVERYLRGALESVFRADLAGLRAPDRERRLDGRHPRDPDGGARSAGPGDRPAARRPRRRAPPRRGRRPAVATSPGWTATTRPSRIASQSRRPVWTATPRVVLVHGLAQAIDPEGQPLPQRTRRSARLGGDEVAPALAESDRPPHGHAASEHPARPRPQLPARALPGRRVRPLEPPRAPRRLRGDARGAPSLPGPSREHDAPEPGGSPPRRLHPGDPREFRAPGGTASRRRRPTSWP